MAKPQALSPIILGTANPGKLKEMRQILTDSVHTFLSLTDISTLPPELKDIPETGTTFAANALIKATAIGNFLLQPVIAEDSGLEVTALNGQPGVYSRRFGASDPDRIQKLLNELKHVPPDKRQAAFICHAVYYDPLQHLTYHAEGRVDGEITLKPEGNQGFGYDPIFFCPEVGKTFAQMSPLEKNQVSHRRRALALLKTMY